METNEIKMLRQELAALKEKNISLEREIASIKKLQDFDREQMLKHVRDRLHELDEYIFPTFHKVFPDYAATTRRIDTILKTGPGSRDEKKDGAG
jgi:hypothetical protein